jgi:hypothetical protein
VRRTRNVKAREVQVQVRSGAARVVASGVATTFGGAGLEVSVELGSTTARVVLDFRSSGGEPAVVSEEIPGGYRLVCDNFDDAYGRGSAVPVLLGEVGEDLAFLHFRVQRFGRSEDRTVTFTFYLAAKEAMGWVPRTAAG